MSKLILFSPFYKAKDNNMGGYARYLATRDGVQLPENTKLNLPVTKKQTALIEKMLNDFPESRDLHEYADYKEEQTIGNASEFISRVLESNLQIFGMGKYLKYIGTRPGAERIAEHGLFSDKGVPVILNKVEEELNSYQGNVWTHIISLRREDAARLGFDNVKAWQKLLWAKRNEIAANMNIDPKNFRWYAAFHNEGHHPHIHMIAYSTQPTEAFLARKGLRNIKSCLAKEIFKDELIQIYKKQTDYRNELKADSKSLAERLVNELRHGDFNNENIAQLLFKLNNMLYHTKGKKVYGYLSPEIKAVVNLIVDELEKDERIKALYALWYEQKDKITSTYTNEKLKRIPLSQNKEFKSVRNMVIREALGIDDMIAIFDYEATDEPILLSIDETEPEPDDEEIDDDLYILTSSEKYWRAKRLLDKKSEQFDFGKGFVLLKESAEEGNPYAQYMLGKMMIKGNMCDKDIRSGTYWLEQSVRQGNQWAEYYLGKQYLGNSDMSRNFKIAIFLLSESAEQGNKYAQYTLACQYLFSDEFKNKTKDGLKLLERSAENQFVPAEKMLAFIILKGELLPKDEKRAYNLLLRSVSLGDDKAQYALAKLLLRSDVIPKDIARTVELLQSAIEQNNEWAKVLLGKMLLFGIDIPKDEEKGIELLQSAAEQWNIYATVILQNRENYLKYLMAISAMRLFGYMGNLFSKKFNAYNSKTGFRIDRKQRRQIEEKKMAQGLRA